MHKKPLLSPSDRVIRAGFPKGREREKINVEIDGEVLYALI